MVRTSPSPPITTPLPLRSVPRTEAVNASSGIRAWSDSTPDRMRSRSMPKAQDFGIDLERTLSGVLSLHARIPEEAFTASVLGTDRSGNGVVIGADGLVLTIGYLITEAEEVWLFSADGRATPAHVVGYDQETGFGLVQALGRLNLPPLEIGTARALHEHDRVVVAGSGGLRRALSAEVVAKREFAG